MGQPVADLTVNDDLALRIGHVFLARKSYPGIGLKWFIMNDSRSSCEYHYKSTCLQRIIDNLLDVIRILPEPMIALENRSGDLCVPIPQAIAVCRQVDTGYDFSLALPYDGPSEFPTPRRQR